MSLALLSYLGRRLMAWPVLILVTARTEEVHRAEAALTELARDQRLHRLDLGPLSPEHTTSLARSLVAPGIGADDLAVLLQHVWRLSEGNPFVVTETMRTLAAEEAPAGAASLALPDSIRSMTRSRLRRLSERAQRMVTVAAVIGRECDLALLTYAAGTSELEAGEALEELVRAHSAAGVRRPIRDRPRPHPRGRVDRSPVDAAAAATRCRRRRDPSAPARPSRRVFRGARASLLRGHTLGQGGDSLASGRLPSGRPRRLPRGGCLLRPGAGGARPPTQLARHPGDRGRHPHRAP